MRSKTGKTLNSLIESYRGKYEAELAEAGVREEWQSEKEFLVLSTYLLNKLYASVAKIEHD